MSEEIIPLNREIETKNNLYQTFYLIGLDSDDIFSNYFFENINSNSFSPKLISKYPPFSKSYNNLPDDLIIKHCFPFGFGIKNIKNINNIKGETFYFTLNNHPMDYIDNGQYKKIYFTCRIIYEKISTISSFREKYAEATKKELTSFPNDLKDFFVPKALCLASLLSFPRESSKILEVLDSCVKREFTNPIEKILENIFFNVPLIPRGHFEVQCNIAIPQILLSFSRPPLNQIPVNSSELDILFNTLKCEEVLDIFKYFLLEVPILFFSKSISNLTSFIENALLLIYPFNYKYPTISILPLSCYSAIEAFSSFIFGINISYTKSFFDDNHIDISDKTVVIVDLDNKYLNPLKLSREEKPFLYLNQPITSESTVNDNNSIETLSLPLHYKKKLSNNLIIYLNKVKSKGTNEVGKNEFNSVIRDIFFYFIISIISDYSKYLKLEKSHLFSLKESNITIDDLLDTAEFLDDVKSNDVMFYKRFLSTKLFLDFVIRKVFPKSNDEKLTNIFIDEKIIYKKNKRIFASNTETPFINFKDINQKEVIQTSNIIPFSVEESFEIIKKENILKAMTYFQNFSVKETDSQTKKILIKYPIFPKLLYDNHFFYKNYESLFISSTKTQKRNLMLEAEDIYIAYLSNPKFTVIYNGSPYNLNLYDNLYTNCSIMKTYVELTWLFILAGSLSYCDKEERDIRIELLFDLVEKMLYIEEDVFEYIFMVLLKIGTEAQVIKMYEYMIKFEELNTYTNYALLCMKMSKKFNGPYNIIKQSSQVTLIMRESKENMVKNSNNLKPFRKRKLLNHQRNSEISNEKTEFIKFESMHKCESCGTDYEMNINQILKLKRGEKKLNMPCPLCNEDIDSMNLKLRVMIGDNEECQIESFKLLTPDEMCSYSMKVFLKNFNYKIDIENLRVNYSVLFYNYLFYFALCNLPFDFIIPYENEVTEKHDGGIIYREFSDLKIESQTSMGEILVESKLFGNTKGSDY